MACSPLSSEIELIRKAQQGDRQAFSELVCTHYRSVLQVVYRMCGNVQMAEDAAQEAFLQAWLHLNSYRPYGSFKCWLFRIAINAAIDELRREAKVIDEDVDDLPLMDTLPGPETALHRSDQAAEVQNLVLALPEACRAVLVLREFEGLSYHEIAVALDIPLGTVMSRLNYARGWLRENLAVQLRFEEVANV